jgi:predicted RecB family endonuclease
MALPGYKEIIELVKVGATIEAQEKIMELRQAALSIQEENVQLRNRVLELEERIKTLERADGDPCPRCRKKTWVVEKSEPDRKFGALGGIRRTYKCTECGLSESMIVTK